MLLSSGVKINASEVVPVIIDPDIALKDKTIMLDALRNYQKIHNSCKFETGTSNQFFKTKINTILPDVAMSLANINNYQFQDYIELATMDKANQAFASVLFSDSNLNMKLEKGFQGNPNTGSIVLNQITTSEDFEVLARTFMPDDRIFVVSSIFGGTGASGFPLLVKNIRNLSSDIANASNVKNAKIGAVTVLPYFSVDGVKDDDSTADAKDDDSRSVNSSTFITKTQAALKYYSKNLHDINAMYYIGDNVTNVYKRGIGGNDQNNEAHFIEFACALAIIDFMDISDSYINSNVYKEFGIKGEPESDIMTISFSDFEDQTKDLVKKPMTQFMLFAKYIREQIDNSKKQPWAIDLGFDDSFFTSDFYKSRVLKSVDDVYKWYTELERNKRSFCPFKLESEKNVFSFVKGDAIAKLPNLNSNYALFDTFLNKAAKNISMSLSIEERFVELFYVATKRLCEKKLRLN